MSCNFYSCRILKSLVLCVYFFVASIYAIDNASDKRDCHSVWHYLKNGRCHCGTTKHGILSCDEKFVDVGLGVCITWNNVTSSEEVHRCLFTKKRNLNYTCVIHDFYHISMTTTGEKLNSLICSEYNRQGKYCSLCVDGYGPAMFSDDAICADCSIYRHLWILNLVFQLFMVTVLCLLLMLFQVKGTSSPFNAITMYTQLATLGLKVSGNVHTRLICFLGQTFTNIIVICLGVFNLDFFHTVIPPFCISTSMKSINIVLFDYIIASYPLFLTMLIYLCIEVHDRQHIIPCQSYPIARNCFRTFHTSWNPKQTILNTFATFLLLSYSKLLFTSISLLLAFHSYNSHGDRVSSSALLIYDPTVRFLHSEHIPHATIALLVIVIFIILPPLLLLLYPTSIFKKCLVCLGFRRWDILHHIMDIFQGWYKDGTEGTRDYRPLSALYMLLRIALSCEFVVQMLSDNYNYRVPNQWLTIGIFNIILGMAFFVLQPYKQKWMNDLDGWIFILVGILLLLEDNKIVYIIGGVSGLLTMAFLSVYAGYHKCRN